LNLKGLEAFLDLSRTALVEKIVSIFVDANTALIREEKNELLAK